jgi:tetraacyldisaccharide 4'-kinase
VSDPAPRPWHTLRTLVHPLASPCYARAVAKRNARFDAGRGVRTAPVPVVSVGNLSTGGTGKTPFVTWLASTLLQRGRRPAIALRGYAPKGGGPASSDEAALYRALLPGVPVLVGADRYAQIVSALADVPAPSPAPFDCVLLDDGFQHRRLARALDVVLIDALAQSLDDRAWSGRLLPGGDLREPPQALARAGAIVITHACAARRSLGAPAVEALLERARTLNPRALLSTADHTWTTLHVIGKGHLPSGQLPVSWLAGRHVVALCAIGQPARFLAQLAEAGAVVHRSLVLPDHHPLSPATIALAKKLAFDAAAGAGPARSPINQPQPTLILTEKDWARLVAQGGPVPPQAWQDLTVVAPGLALEPADPEPLVNLVMAQLVDQPPTGR